MWKAVDWVGRGLGMLAGGGAAFLWISAIWFPRDGLDLSGPYLLPTAVLMAVIGLVSAIASYHAHLRIMLIGFVASFLPVGLALMDADHFLRYASRLNIVLAVATLVILVARLGEKNE